MRYAATVCAILIVMIALMPVALAAELSGQNRLDAIDRRVLDRELELLAINATIKQHSQPHSMWEARRWVLYSVSNSSLTAAGAMINSVERLENEKIGKTNKDTIINAAKLRVLANCISTVGASAEFALNEYKYWWKSKHGFNLKVIRQRVIQLRNELDGLFAERDALARQVPLSSYAAEGAVLREVKDVALSQFARYYGEFKGQRVRQQLNYVLTATSNALSGTGSYVGIVATRKKKAKLGGTGGITDIVSGSMNISVPLVVRIGDWTQTRLIQAIYCRRLQCSRKYSLEAVRHHIAAMRAADKLSSLDDCLLEDEKVLAHLEQIVEDQEQFRLKTAKGASRHLAENEINALVGGGAKVVNGIGTVVGTYSHPRYERDRLRVTGAASMVYSTGNIISGVETLRAHISNEVKFHKQGKAGQRPAQVWQRQVDQIAGLRKEVENIQVDVKQND